MQMMIGRLNKFYGISSSEISDAKFKDNAEDVNTVGFFNASDVKEGNLNACSSYIYNVVFMSS